MRTSSQSTVPPKARLTGPLVSTPLRIATDQRVLRRVHLLPALVVGTFVYAPWTDVEWFALLVRAVAFPLLVGAGLLM